MEQPAQPPRVPAVRLKKQTSFTESAYRALHADIVTGRIPPGTQLKAADLAGRLGVGLAAVREALSRLSSESLVDAQPQRGFRSSQVSASRLRDLTDARIEIETICLRQSVAQFDPLADLHLDKGMASMLAAAVESSDGGQVANAAWIDAHAAFHEALVSGCRNAVLRRVRRQLFVEAERYRCLAMSLHKHVADVERDHRAMVDAVKGRDADAAARALADHIEGTARILLSRIGDGEMMLRE